MHKWFGLAVCVLFLLAGSAGAQDKRIRDRSGKLQERWDRKGDSTDVRGRSGKLEERRTRIGDKVYVRDRNGRLLRVEKVR